MIRELEIEYVSENDAPEEWPINQRERKLQLIFDSVVRFRENPTYKNKEVLVSLISNSDLNEFDNRGVHRTTQYEIVLLNSIYLFANVMCLGTLRAYTYKHLEVMTYNHQQIFKIGNEHTDLELDINGIDVLEKSLLLFYGVYSFHNMDRSRAFSDQIIYYVGKMYESANMSLRFRIANSLTRMLNDLSYFVSMNTFGLIRFSRDDLKKLFEFQFRLLKETNQNPLNRPLKGVLMTSISNWVLKSRNDYTQGYLYKCLDNVGTVGTFKNSQIWMNKKEKLNDPREGKFIRDLFSNVDWLRYDWSKNISLEPIRNSFVTSFTKVEPTKEMYSKYGKNVFGYKTDRIMDVVRPIIKHSKRGYIVGQVMAYDIIYDENQAKEEIQYLCEIIEMFDMPSDNKNVFINEIIQYWIYSFKDADWRDEYERRYEVFVYDDYEYIYSIIEGDFLKIDSTIFTFPDFIDKGNIMHSKITENRKEKLNAITTKDYVWCNDCLQSDFDSAFSFDVESSSCSNCNSENIVLVKS